MNSYTTNDNLIIRIDEWIDKLTYNEDELLTVNELEWMQTNKTQTCSITTGEIKDE